MMILGEYQEIELIHCDVLLEDTSCTMRTTKDSVAPFHATDLPMNVACRHRCECVRQAGGTNAHDVTGIPSATSTEETTQKN